MKKISPIPLTVLVVFWCLAGSNLLQAQEPAAQTQSDDERAKAMDKALAEQAAAKAVVENPADTGANLAMEAPADVSSGKLVKSVDIEGNKSIGVATILSKIKTRVGQEYRQNIISDDLKRLYNTGYFSDVRVDRKEEGDGLKVVIYVEEKPIVEEITFSKIRYFSKRSLLSKMKTQAGKFMDKKALNDDVNTIEDLYIKKGLTQVKVEVETFVDEATNKATLHFIVREGFRVKIKKINVLGNTVYKDSRLVKVVKSRPSWLFNSGYYKEDVMAEDMDRLQAFYEKNGYIDAKATYQVEQLRSGLVNVDITVEEGKRYYVGDVDIQGNVVLTAGEILTSMKDIKKGKIFSKQKLADDVANVKSLYFDRGHIFAKVNESTSLNNMTGQVDLKLDVEEGGIAYINKIKIQGNTQTRDIVIRRELRMYPGDQFDGQKLRRSKDRLNSLGYFEEVGFDIEDTDTPEQKNLVVDVKEAKTGTFSFGGGYSTIDSLIGFVELDQKNFDFANWPTFTGGGQQVTLRAEAGSSRNNMLLSFTEPWLFDYPISGGFDLYRSQYNREEDTGYAYDQTRTGAKLRFGKEISEYLSAGTYYRYENVKIGNFEENVSADLLAEEGKNTVSSVGFSLTEDKRDNKIVPSKGWVLTGMTDVAGGPFAGDKDFYRLETNGAYYIPLRFSSVLEFSGKVGMVTSYGDSDKVPIFERYFAGGGRSIRGYDERAIGPFDSVTKDAIGGESVFVGTIEYTIPLVEVIKLAAFFDTGNVWEKASKIGSKKLYSGVGMGFRIKTPIGPMNLDYGIPLDKQPGEDNKESGKFYFSVSRGF
jgi:outer membrane protein insertion porin family